MSIALFQSFAQALSYAAPAPYTTKPKRTDCSYKICRCLFLFVLHLIPDRFSGAAILYFAPHFYFCCTYFRPNVSVKHIITHLFGFFNVKMHKLSIKIPSY